MTEYIDSLVAEASRYITSQFGIRGRLFWLAGWLKNRQAWEDSAWADTNDTILVLFLREKGEMNDVRNNEMQRMGTG
jgi:hypothetical protein